MMEFERAKVIDQGQECWSARTLCDLLGYKDWDDFIKVINRARESCINTGGDQYMHFREATEIVMAGFSSKNKTFPQCGSRSKRRPQTETDGLASFSI